ncbi:MAG: hypothetical protein ACRC7W_05710 [Fusobacteriaceae bacterium]
MERKIGEVFEFKGVMLRVEEEKYMCKSCHFYHINSQDDESCENNYKIIGQCTDVFRDDGLNIIFVEVQK